MYIGHEKGKQILVKWGGADGRGGEGKMMTRRWGLLYIYKIDKQTKK